MTYAILAVLVVGFAAVFVGSLMGMRVALRQIDVTGRSLGPRRRIAMWLSLAALLTAVAAGTVTGEVTNFTGQVVGSTFAGGAIGCGAGLMLAMLGVAHAGHPVGAPAPYAFETRFPSIHRRDGTSKR